MLEQLKIGESFNVNDYVLLDEGVYKTIKSKQTGKNELIRLCEPLFVKETVQNVDTKDVGLILCYKFKGKYNEMQIGMGQLIPNELIKLLAKGVDIPHENHKEIATYLREQQKLAPHRMIYSQVGWHKDEDSTLVFRHYKVIGKDDKNVSLNDVENGIYNLEPNGSIESWIHMVEDEVKGNIPLETALCIGFSSVIVGYLSREYDDVDTIITHFAGNSTQGKTTAALLAVSAFGAPTNKRKGLMKTWNGTKNAILNSLGGNYGIPIVLDELSMNNSKSLTSELYAISNGQDKARLTDTIELRKQAMWALTLISTGEQSIFERTNNNIGLTVRTFEFSHITWTKSAENSDKIKSIIQENYGYAGVKYVEYIVEKGLKIIDDKWQAWQDICQEQLTNTPFRSRIAKKYAIIMTAGEIAKEALEIELDLDSILKFLIEQEEARMDSRDIGLKALNSVIQLIIQYEANFRTELNPNIPLNCWGKLLITDKYYEVSFLKNVLEKQLKELGFDDIKIIVRDWQEKGILVTESDRPTRRLRIFHNNEQEHRKRALESKKVPKKLEDTTYTLKIAKENFEKIKG